MSCGEAARDCTLGEGRARAPWWWSAPRKGREGTHRRQSGTQHSKQPPPQTPLHTHPARRLYLKPASRAAVGTGQLEGKRSGVTQQTPATTPTLPPSPGPPGPRLGRGGHLQRAPTFLDTPTSTRTDRAPRPAHSPPGAHTGTPQPRQAGCTGPEAPQDPGTPAGRGREGVLRGRSQGHPATTYPPDWLSLVATLVFRELICRPLRRTRLRRGWGPRGLFLISAQSRPRTNHVWLVHGS